MFSVVGVAGADFLHTGRGQGNVRNLNVLVNVSNVQTPGISIEDGAFKFEK